MERLLIVPAAGVGSRLGGAVPKILVQVNGRPMIEHILQRYSGAVEHVAVIVHPTAVAAVRAVIGSAAEMFVQHEPTGMLDAIMLARPAVEAHRPRRVLITWCDQIAIHSRTIARLCAATTAPADPLLILPTCRTAEPYTHFERDAAGRILRVLHRREADPMPAVGESDAGVFDLSLTAYLDLLLQYACEADRSGWTGERNFVPFVAWLSSRAPVETFPCVDAEEAIGVNTPDDLARVERYLRNRSDHDA